MPGNMNVKFNASWNIISTKYVESMEKKYL